MPSEAQSWAPLRCAPGYGEGRLRRPTEAPPIIAPRLMPSEAQSWAPLRCAPGYGEGRLRRPTEAPPIIAPRLMPSEAQSWAPLRCAPGYGEGRLRRPTEAPPIIAPRLMPSEAQSWAPLRCAPGYGEGRLRRLKRLTSSVAGWHTTADVADTRLSVLEPHILAVATLCPNLRPAMYCFRSTPDHVTFCRTLLLRILVVAATFVGAGAAAQEPTQATIPETGEADKRLESFDQLMRSFLRETEFPARLSP